ncbi:interleukin-13 receptor subunit alpha-1 isoform X2 [Corythoichthys intestinalis]|uniref:interleukin-13 receptor subunit alpha-1 isoform X2 n=1 Tax=Corythoichthys intestinalis TaxID=161448 RepID=UPI0025A5BF38|nr:interleukin-13 receptor subunit alpha-1 isoform X2 [Corythoichthys intestinalis]
MSVKCLLLFVAVCFWVSAEPRTPTGELSPPRNLTFRWLSDFNPQLRWAHELLPPQCNYKVSWATTEKNSRRSRHTPGMSISNFIMEGGSIFFSVQTTCNQKLSEPAYLNVTYPELVSVVQCSIITSTLTQCTWASLRFPPDLAFYYWLVNELDDSDDASLSECPEYMLTEGERTGCRLKSKTDQSITMLFNATVKGSLVRNTFKKKVVEVTPYPLSWNVSEVAGKFNLSWIPPDVLRLKDWSFIINFTECDTVKEKKVKGATWTLMNRVSHCQYQLTIKAQSIRGETGWSDVKHFGAEKNPNVLLYATIFIPLLCVGLVTLICYYFRRNKEDIFIKVPEPRDLLSDICNNNNKSELYNFNFPEKEEEECQISVVTDQQLHS